MGRTLRTFRSKVITLTLLVVVGTQATTVISVLIANNRDVDTRASEDLRDGSRIFQKLKENRAYVLRQILLPLAAEPGFIAAVENEDSLAITEELSKRAAWIGADIAIVSNAEGSPIAASGVPVSPARDFSRLGADQYTTISIDNRYFDMVSIPITGLPEKRYVSMGYALNDALAQRFASIAGLEMTLMVMTPEKEIILLGSSLSRDQRDLIVSTGKKIAGGMRPQLAADAMSAEYLSIRVPYFQGRQDISAVMQAPLNEAMAPFAALRGTLLHSATTSVLCALLMAFYMSSSVTKPVHKLLMAARRIKVGNYTAKLDINTNDEFGELAGAFDSMREGISQREKRIVYQSRFDHLTGLANRDHGIELLRHELRNSEQTQKPVAIMIMHLRRYREIQISLGHNIGDEVLRMASMKVREQLEEEPILARLDGGRFLIVLRNTDEQRAYSIARNLTSVIDHGLSAKGVNLTLEACTGIAICPDHGTEQSELLRKAAIAKNDAYQQHDRIRVYQKGRKSSHLRRLAILGDMRRAVDNNELKLYLHPKINITNWHACGAEALMRWEHPELGTIPPSEFIPLAESAGSISMLTEWVLCKTIQHIAQWQKQNINLPISINLSSLDLLNSDLPTMIGREMKAHDVSPDSVILEVTEEAAVQDIEKTVEVLQRLREIGMKISMDDFGTGYSSLGHLQQLKIDELKIDKSFVTDLPDNQQNAAIVRSVIELAHNLNLEVVAEGVESAATLRWLNHEGCERAQGHYLSTPIPAADYPAWISHWEMQRARLRNAESQQVESQTKAAILKPFPVNG